jgi:hypothetical protein
VCMEFHDKFIKLHVHIPHIIHSKTHPMHHHRLIYHYNQVNKFATLMTGECQWGKLAPMLTSSVYMIFAHVAASCCYSKSLLIFINDQCLNMHFVHSFCNGKGRAGVFHTQTLSAMGQRKVNGQLNGYATLPQVAKCYFSCLVKLSCIFPQRVVHKYP